MLITSPEALTMTLTFNTLKKEHELLNRILKIHKKIFKTKNERKKEQTKKQTLETIDDEEEEEQIL